MRGTAFSIVGLATGGSLLVGNLVAGKLMDVTYRNGMGHIGAFLWGLSATCLATFALVYLSIMGDVDGPTATSNELTNVEMTSGEVGVCRRRTHTRT